MDYGRAHEEQTGLVYNCPVAPGQCGGVTGDISVYSNDALAYDNDASIENRFDITDTNIPQSFDEGKLFDQARKSLFLSAASTL